MTRVKRSIDYIFFGWKILRHVNLDVTSEIMVLRQNGNLSYRIVASKFTLNLVVMLQNVFFQMENF